MSILAPSIVPRDDDQNIYLVADDLGQLSRVWREAVAGRTDLETFITEMLGCQYAHAVKIAPFNPGEGWSRDVSEDVAAELRPCCKLPLTGLPPGRGEPVSVFETGSRQQLCPRLV